MTRIWTASLSRCVHWELCAFAAGMRQRASLSCGPIGCTGESLSQIHGDELLVRVPHADDGVTAHIDETLSLVLVWILHKHALFHAVGHNCIATQGCNVGSDHRKHLRYERVEKAADSTFLPQRRGLPDEEHVDDAEVLDDAHAGEEGERRHLHHRDGAAAVRTAGAQRARASLRQRTGAL